eukprot:gb/GECH01008027.1/.p1 GENE.gb/GECH01008027.1/~~gb/GECH01008027.1/.p1  ORF type:complete len:160 (+),score=6.62 gb/GECH01008027.1/:1-480(+)
MSLFVGRLTHNIRSEDLRDLFERYGPLTRCEVKKTYGFVTYEYIRDAEDAMDELQSTEIKGARINIEWTKSSGRYNHRRSRRGRYEPYRRPRRYRSYSRSWSRDRYSRSRSRSPGRYRRYNLFMNVIYILGVKKLLFFFFEISKCIYIHIFYSSIIVYM